jgi:hypothetical protein
MDDPADRCVFVVDDEGWDALQRLLDRPAVRNPKLASLLREPMEDGLHRVSFELPGPSE